VHNKLVASPKYGNLVIIVLSGYTFLCYTTGHSQTMVLTLLKDNNNS